jgi:hypothetical protein
VEPNIQMDGALHNNDHFFFYKDETNGEDFVYATPRCLINGLVTGSSTILFEIIASNKKLPEFMYSILNFIGIGELYSYKLAKSLIGVAQRDYKQAKKLSGDERLKKIKWSTAYAEWVQDMLEYFSVSFETGDDLEQQYKNMREASKQLPNCVEPYVFRHMSKYCVGAKDIPELELAQVYYYNNWRESL